tara:strand:+ start:35 stop:316 length:282 start_codon:yes stop_codon:yes gene_type:complete
MKKEQLIDKHAQTLKSWVGTSLAKDECIGLIKNAVDEALALYGVGCSLPTKEGLTSLVKEINDIDTHKKMTANYLTAEEAGKRLFEAMKGIKK